MGELLCICQTSKKYLFDSLLLPVTIVISHHFDDALVVVGLLRLELVTKIPVVNLG